MKKKIQEKLERRFLSLPLHHIDTSIIFEPEKTEDGKYCRKYLQLAGYKYRGKFSSPTLSEIFLEILLLKTSAERYTLLDTVTQLIKVRKIEFYFPVNIRPILQKIEEIDKRILGLDREILACAVEDKAVTLATLDKRLINNQPLERGLNIKIKHPKDLI